LGLSDGLMQQIQNFIQEEPIQAKDDFDDWVISATNVTKVLLSLLEDNLDQVERQKNRQHKLGNPLDLNSNFATDFSESIQ